MNPTSLDDAVVNSTHGRSPTCPESLNSKIFELLEDCVDSLLASLAHSGDYRGGRILTLRNGLVDGHKWTLEEVGRDLGITRERVRQLQAKANRRLSQSAKHLLSSQIDHCVKELRSFGERIGEDLASERFTQALSTADSADQSSISAHLSLLQSIIGNSRIEKQSLHEVDLRIVHTLAESSVPLSVNEIRNTIESNPEACKATTDWPDLDLAMHLQLVLYVEIDSGGYCTPTEQTFLGLSNTDRRLLSLTRVLREEGRPLHFTEIARRVRPLLTGKLAMSDRNVHAWMDRYKDYFKWAGPGIYGLAEWDIGVRDGSLEGGLRPARRMGIGDEIAFLLSERKKPMSLGFIEDHILERFKVHRTSVYASITQDTANRFVLLDDGMVALSSWHIRSQLRTTSETKRRVRVPRDLREAARSTARSKASELTSLISQGTASITPAKAAGYAVVAATLGMTHELKILLDIAEESNMPASMSHALKRLPES